MMAGSLSKFTVDQIPQQPFDDLLSLIFYNVVDEEYNGKIPSCIKSGCIIPDRTDKTLPEILQAINEGIDNMKETTSDNMKETTSSLCYAAEFDNHPDIVGRVEVRQGERNDALVVVQNNTTHVLVEVDRDQWGVFLTIGGIRVAQEDKTRSFIDALIGGLQKIKSQNEFDTTPATVLPTETQTDESVTCTKSEEKTAQQS